MARKTQNSSQSLPSALVQTLHNEGPHYNTRERKNKSSSVPATTTTDEGHKSRTAEGRRDTDDAEEEDVAEHHVGEPAVIAPSSRSSKKNDETGHTTSKDASRTSTTSRGGSGFASDDDDYAAVDEISDSSDDEPDVEELTKIITAGNRNALPTTNHLHWYQHEEKIQGILGEDDSFFDQHHWVVSSDSDSSGSDIDYHTAWDGFPETPMAPRTPMSLPSPSPRRVRFESGTPDCVDGSRNGMDSPDEDDATKDSVAAKSPVDAVGTDDVVDGSGYESEAETTDDEEPPVPAGELIKAPYLLHHSPAASVDLTQMNPHTFTLLPSDWSDRGFKVPTTPASRRRRSGPELGTFKQAATRSYTVARPVKDTNVLMLHHAARPSSVPPIQRQSSFEKAISNSAPPTPSMSRATLSLVPDLSDTEFSDAMASQFSADPILSAGPDFIASAGFARTATTSVSRPVSAHANRYSSELFPQDTFDAATFLSRQSLGVEAQFDDPDEEEFGESAFEDMINFDESSSEEEESVMSLASPISDTPAMPASSPSAQIANRNSPSSASSIHGIDLFKGVDVSGWRQSANQRTRPRQPSKRSPHRLSLSRAAHKSSHNHPQSSTSSKKRKIDEIHDRMCPPTSNNKRRLQVGSR